MKPDPKLRKALLLDEEIQVLLDYYDRILEDGAKWLKSNADKPITKLIAEQVALSQERRSTIARYTDGRTFNRGTGRRKKETAPSEKPVLPLETPKQDKENRPF